MKFHEGAQGWKPGCAGLPTLIDPAVLTVSAVVLALVALAAGFVPARRASKIDPMRALRTE